MAAGRFFIGSSVRGCQLVNRSYLVAPNGKIGHHYDKIRMFDANVGDGRHYAESKNFWLAGKWLLQLRRGIDWPEHLL